MILGYTTGVFDLFHIGHLNLIKNAKGLCDKLIVGVSTDELVRYKHKSPVIPFHERIEILRSIKYVDAAIPQNELDKIEAWKKIRFDVLFVGDDWFNDDKWRHYESFLTEHHARVVYFPYTQGTSSTLINEILTHTRSVRLDGEAGPG